jgi:predicted transport protein
MILLFKKFKNQFYEFQKKIKKYSDVANNISYKPLKNHVSLGYTKKDKYVDLSMYFSDLQTVLDLAHNIRNLKV